MELTIKSVGKKYGNVQALTGVNITLTEGIYGLLGANGAGKSTLINLITDSLQRSEGEILWNGTDILQLRSNYRDILGYMPQNQGYYKYFCAEDFLVYMGRLKGLKKKEAQERSDYLLKVFNLFDVRKKSIGKFSGGMKQRLMLAQALLNEPKILILDEPTAGVDPEERIRIRNYISEIAQNRIVIIATHIVSDVEAIAKEILVISKGSIVAQDSPQNLIRGISQYVYSLQIQREELSRINTQYKVSNLRYSQDGLEAKIISKDPPAEDNWSHAAANLEDVYLFYCTDMNEE